MFDSSQPYGPEPARLLYLGQEYWNGLIRPSAKDLPDPRIQLASLMSPALACRFFATNANWEAHN